MIGALANADTLCITSTSDFVSKAMLDNDTLAVSDDIQLVNPFGNTNTNPDLRPKSTSPAITGSCFDFTTEFFGVEQIPSIQNVSLYPNPSNGIVNVMYNAFSNTDVIITVLDINGRVMQNLPVIYASEGYNVTQLDVTGYPAGVYLVKIQSGNMHQVQKLIVK